MPDREVNAETRVTDEKEAAVGRGARRLQLWAAKWDATNEERARAVLDGSGVWERIEELERENARLSDALRDIVKSGAYPEAAIALEALAETGLTSGDPEKRKFYPGTPEHDAWLSETEENAENERGEVAIRGVDGRLRPDARSSSCGPMNKTDEIRRRAEWNTEHTLARLAGCWAYGDFAMVGGKLYAIERLPIWSHRGSIVRLVPPSGETAE